MTIPRNLLTLACLSSLAVLACNKKDTDNPSEQSTHFQATSIDNAPRATILSDPEHNRLYFFGGVVNSSAVCYDYEARTVIQRKDIGLFVEPTEVCLGKANNKRELYVGNVKKIAVFDPETWLMTDSIPVFPDTVGFYINTVCSNGENIVFVSPINGVGVRSFNRLTKSLVAQAQGLDANAVAYSFQNGDQTTAVISLGNGGSNNPNGINLDLFDQQGNLLNSLSNPSVDDFSTDNVSFAKNAVFFVSGKHVHALSTLAVAATLPKLYRATAIDPSGSKIYGLSSAGLDVMSYPSLQVEKTLAIPEDMTSEVTNPSSTFHLFFDDNKLFVANSVMKSGVAIFWVTKFDL